MKKQTVIMIARYTIAIAFGILMLIPFYWMIVTSFKSPGNVFSNPINWWVDSFNFDNYKIFFEKYNGWKYIWNTVRLSLINIVGVVVSNAVVAYAVAFMKSRRKRLIMFLLLITMMMPGTVTFFPQFIVYVTLGWYGTMLPLWVPAFLGNAYYIFLLRQYFLTIPKPILDAARVTGASDFRILCQIVVPMAKPVFIIMILSTFIGVWSDLFGPLIYILDESERTFPVLLSYMNSTYGNTGMLPTIMSGAVLSAIPTLVVYFLSQKAMIKAYVFKTGDK
ncbi:MAG: carbohydrate ABC transporter permease [Atopobiaceae bacterium]|jgi:multiple sugar transport system permease protein